MASNLRSFERRDRAAVLELSRRALARPDEQVGSPLWTSGEELEAELADLDLAPEETLRVAEEDGAVAGFGGVEIADRATVYGPLVAAAYRGRRIGSLLLEASIEIARDHGVRRLVATVGLHNVGGQLLLERTRFRRRGGLGAIYRLFPAAYRPVKDAPPGVQARVGGTDDLAATFLLYREAASPPGGRSEAVWLRWLERGEVYLAEADGALVAFVHVEPGRRRISHVGVKKEARGRGVGGFLFSRVLADYWGDHPDQELRLSVAPYDLAAIRLYQRLGFAPWLVLQTFELEL